MNIGDLILTKERLYILKECNTTEWKKILSKTILIVLDIHKQSGKIKVIMNDLTMGWLDEEGCKFIEIIKFN
jgi:hypothetical protein